MTTTRKRNGRAHQVRSSSVTVSDLKRITLPTVQPSVRQLPRTRAECVDGIRPCPYLTCRHHLAFDVAERTGSLKANFPDLEPDELPVSCSLDVADAGGATMHDAGAYLNITRARIQQVEVIALKRLRDECQRRGLTRDDMLHEIVDRTAQPGRSEDDE